MSVRLPENTLAVPVIARNTTPEQWHKFLSSWTRFKLNKGITDPFYLLICCEPGLRSEVMNSGNNISCKSEDEILAAIKILAVRTLAQRRMKLFNMKQEPDVSTEAFVASLRREANNCNFSTHCDILSNRRAMLSKY